MDVVILDRDGVINVDSANYIKSVSEWEPIPGSIEAIRLLSNHGCSVYIATNQAGLARQLFCITQLQEIHDKLLSLVEEAGGEISGIFYCPHHPDEGCECRKPAIGLLQQIAIASGESLQGQPFVGDSLKDIQAAEKMGCQPVLVRTGNGSETIKQIKDTIPVYDNLLAFASSYIIQ